MRLAVAEEIAERFGHRVFGHRRCVRRVLRPRRGADLQEDVVAGGVRIGVRSVEVDVGEDRAVEAVRLLVGGRAGAGIGGGLVAASVGVRELAGVDLIEKGQLDQIADARAQGGTGHRLDQLR